MGCCCGLFSHKKKHNKKNKHGANTHDFAPRPVQHVVQDGRMTYRPTAHQQQFGGGQQFGGSQQFGGAQQYGINENDINEQAANKAMFQGAAAMATHNMNPTVQKFAQKGVSMGMDKYNQQQQAKQQRAQQAEQYGGGY